MLCFAGREVLLLLLCLVPPVYVSPYPARPPHVTRPYSNLGGGGGGQVCVDLMLWSSEKVREFSDVGTMGTVSRVTGGRVTYLRGGEAGGQETEAHVREQLTATFRDHAQSASEAILKVSRGVRTFDGGSGVRSCSSDGWSPSDGWSHHNKKRKEAGCAGVVERALWFGFVSSSCR